jgi:hypothetical protein
MAFYGDLKTDAPFDDGRTGGHIVKKWLHLSTYAGMELTAFIKSLIWPALSVLNSV